MTTNDPLLHERNLGDVVRIAKGCLGTILDESGTILYSSCETLKSGKYYFLGLNPGGPEEGTKTIGRSLDELSTSTVNAYLDESWCNDPDCKGCRPLQKRFKFLFDAVLKVEDPRTVCASNLIFNRSTGENDAGGKERAETCWPVHEVILQIVQPQVIITFGRLPFDFILDKFGGTPPESSDSGHGKWQWRTSRLQTNQTLIGLPHLSRYALNNNPTVIKGIQEIIRKDSVFWTRNV